MYRKNYEGSISLYLCLVIGIIIPLVLTMYESAKYSAMKLQVECAVDIGMDSCLAEYHRQLLDEYGLLFVDMGYSEGNGSVANVNEHIDNYITSNLDPTRPLLLRGCGDLFGLKTGSVNITKLSRATDENGSVFRYMALSYMLEYYGYSYVTDVMNMCEKTVSSGVMDVDIEKESSEATARLNGFSLSDEEREEYEIEEDLEYDNPAEGMEQVRNMGILSLVCKGDISGKGISPERYVSKRNLSVGNGMYQGWKSRNSLLDEVLFNEYIMLMCGNYMEPKENSLIDYQVEYVISGKSNDTEILKDIVNRIMLIRGSSNTIYFLGSYHMEEATAMAETIAALCGFPPIAPLLEAVIIFSWIYAESIYDVKQIMNGGKVPLVTTDADWDLDIESAINNTLETLEGDAPCSQEGMGYVDFLRVFLYLSDKNMKTKGMMDIVEMDIRKHTDNQNFRLDDCVAAFNLQSVITSTSGYEFLVDKEFAYQ